jgi:hypothetical protein
VDGASRSARLVQSSAPRRRRVFLAIETTSGGSPLSRVIDACLIILIIGSVVAVVLESVKALESRFSAAFYWFEVFTVFDYCGY